MKFGGFWSADESDEEAPPEGRALVPTLLRLAAEEYEREHAEY
jgi:hypothetical protein